MPGILFHKTVKKALEENPAFKGIEGLADFRDASGRILVKEYICVLAGRVLDSFNAIEKDEGSSEFVLQLMQQYGVLSNEFTGNLIEVAEKQLHHYLRELAMGLIVERCVQREKRQYKEFDHNPLPGLVCSALLEIRNKLTPWSRKGADHDVCHRH